MTGTVFTPGVVNFSDKTKPPPNLPEPDNHGPWEASVDGRDVDVFGAHWYDFSNFASLGYTGSIVGYAVRSGVAHLPVTDVWYVHIGGLGYLVHESELELTT